MAIKKEERTKRLCKACGGPDMTTHPLVRYYGNGSSKFLHPVCVGSYLTSNPDESLCFEPGEVPADA